MVSSPPIMKQVPLAKFLNFLLSGACSLKIEIPLRQNPKHARKSKMIWFAANKKMKLKNARLIPINHSDSFCHALPKQKETTNSTNPIIVKGTLIPKIQVSIIRRTAPTRIKTRVFFLNRFPVFSLLSIFIILPFS